MADVKLPLFDVQKGREPQTTSALVAAAQAAAATFKPEYMPKRQGDNAMDVIMSLDVEVTGIKPVVHQMVAFGVVIGLGAIWPSGKATKAGPLVLEKKRWCLPVPAVAKTFEPRCASEYWMNSEQRKQLEQFEAEAKQKTAKQSLLEFVQLVESYEKSCKLVYKVADNVAFDFGFLHEAMVRELDHVPLWMSTVDQLTYVGKVHSPVEAAFDFRKRAGGGKFANFCYDKDLAAQAVAKLTPTQHDHMPDNDAEVNYYKTWLMMFHDAPYSEILNGGKAG